MIIRIFRPRATQILILVVVLTQAGLIVLVYIKKSWTYNINLFPELDHEEDIVRHKSILTDWREANNPGLNFFTKQLPTDDKKRLVNLTNFDYKIKKESLCQNEGVLLLVAVSSAPENQLKRMIIRETWGQPDSEVKLVFMLADTNNLTINEAIRTEDISFNDIVQGNFVDSYKNMTYKSTMSLKFAIYNCPVAKFLLKCDDDVLINTPLLKNFLKNDFTAVNAKNGILCTVNNARAPIRSSVGHLRKWYVSYKEWPHKYFPLYCAGWYYIMELGVAFDIYRHAQNTPFFWIDDVFLTGIAAKNVQGLKYIDITRFTLADISSPDDILDGNLGNLPFLVGSFNMLPKHIQILWQYVSSRPVPESIIGDLFKISYQNQK